MTATYNGRGRKSIELLKEEVARGEIFVKGAFIVPVTDKQKSVMAGKPEQIRKSEERTAKTKRQTVSV